MAGGTAADPGFVWALVVGVLLVALGLLGFVPNPIVGSPSPAWGTPLLLTGDAHDVLHLVAGAVALHAAFGMSRAHRDAVLIGLGAAALILLALGLLDGRWFGIAPFHVGLADQLLHLIVGVGSLIMGLAGTGAITVPVVTGAYRRSELGLAGAAIPAVSEPQDVLADGTGLEGAPEPVAEVEPVEPVEAMPEPLGLDLDIAESETAAEPETLAGPETAAEPETVAAPEPPAETGAETRAEAEALAEAGADADAETRAETAEGPPEPAADDVRPEPEPG
jgi:hypothetical protein